MPASLLSVDLLFSSCRAIRLTYTEGVHHDQRAVRRGERHARPGNSFSLDHQGRFLCNTLQEAFASTGQAIAGRKRDFDVIIIGGGTFGSVIAEHLFVNDTTRSRQILVLEAGPFVLPEHVQNMPFQGGGNPRVPWVNHPSLAYGGLIYAIGGRSLTWGGWSPELLDEEWATWPQSVRNALRPVPPANPAEGYFAKASRYIGVKETNDFIYGLLIPHSVGNFIRAQAARQ